MRDNENCGECKFWVVMGYSEGQCKRYPPYKSDYVSGYGVIAKWLETRENDWCGEFLPKPKEQAL